jgi:hypothetical protein
MQGQVHSGDEGNSIILVGLTLQRELALGFLLFGRFAQFLHLSFLSQLIVPTLGYFDFFLVTPGFHKLNLLLEAFKIN